MFKQNQLLVALVLAISCLTLLVKSSDISSVKIHLVDYSDILDNGYINYFFRGNEPKRTFSNGTTVFAYDDLVEYILNNSRNVGVTIPDEFYIIDIKLITGPLPSEMPDIRLERDFFAANPQLGQYGQNRTLGDLVDPNILPESDMIHLAKTLPKWQLDNLPKRMAQYKQILNTPRHLPTVLYVHCECGCDRTGEVMAAYVMKYQGWSFEKAITWDYAIAGRKITIVNQWAAQWYCLYLKYGEGQDIDCTPPPKSLYY
eukprot:gene2886-3587_t